MGNFYTNFVAFGATQDSALNAMRELRRKGYVAPSISGAVTIYDADSDIQDINIIECLGADLSEKLKLPILAALNHDDDHLLLWLFKDGQQESQYSSILHAGSFGLSLSRVRGGLLAYPLVWGVLAWPIFIFQVMRHHLLAWFLNLPMCSVGFGFEYISAGEIPPEISEDDLVKV